MRSAALLLCFLAGLAVAAPGRAASPGPVGQPVEQRFIGASLLHSERISTGKVVSLRVLFADQSVLMLGPNAEVVIEKFAYDPRNGTGHLTIRVLAGAFDYYGGALSAKKSVDFVTDSGKFTIGDGPGKGAANGR